DALAHVPLAARRSRPATVLLALAAVAALVGLVGAGLLLAQRLGAQPPWLPATGAVAATLALALLLLGVSTVTRLRAARLRGEKVVADGRAAIEAAARARLLVPTHDVLAEHRHARELAA